MHRGCNHGDNKAEDKIENPHGNKADAQRKRLRRVKLYEGPLVDEKKNQAADPTEEIAEQTGYVFLYSCCRRIRSRSRSGDCRARSTTLRSPALRTKRCLACVRSAGLRRVVLRARQ